MLRLLPSHVKPFVSSYTHPQALQLFCRSYTPVAMSGLPHYGVVRQQLIEAAATNNFTDERWVTAAYAQKYLLADTKAQAIRVKLPQGDYIDILNMSTITIPHNFEVITNGGSWRSKGHRSILGFSFGGSAQDFFSAHAQAYGLKSTCWVTEDEMAALQWKAVEGATPLQLDYAVVYGFGKTPVSVTLFNAQQIIDVIDFKKYFIYRRMFQLSKGTPLPTVTTLEIQQHLTKIGISFDEPSTYTTPNRFVGTRADIQRLTSHRCDVLPDAIPFRQATGKGDIIELYVPAQTNDPSAVSSVAMTIRKAKLDKGLANKPATTAQCPPMELSI